MRGRAAWERKTLEEVNASKLGNRRFETQLNAQHMVCKNYSRSNSSFIVSFHSKNDIYTFPLHDALPICLTSSIPIRRPNRVFGLDMACADTVQPENRVCEAARPGSAKRWKKLTPLS